MSLQSITKVFGKTLALDGAFLSVRTGTVHALLGENGAGKTTLMRIAFGMIAPDAGTINVNGEEQHFASPAEAIAQGIGMVHQHFMLVPAMTVAENVALGNHGRYNATIARKRVTAVSQQYGLTVDPNAIVRDLPIVAQQRVEILKALARNARILILDEPTAVLAPVEAHDLLLRMRVFADTGGTVVLITHKLKDALAFADDVTVLRHGKTVLQRQAHQLDEQSLAEAMIGKTPHNTEEERYGQTHASTPTPTDAPTHTTATQPPRQPIFSLDTVSFRDRQNVERLKQVSLTVHAGEILGIAGVEGNGQYELLRILAGRMTATAGKVTIPHTVGFVPEDRHRDAVILDFPLYQNVALFQAGRRRGWTRWSTYRARTNTLLHQHDVRASGVEMPVRALSGGNQQKFVVGREMEGAPQALVVENPTRGLDIQATQTVHQRLRQARAQGAAIVVYSSDLDEVLALADRVMVVYEGQGHDVPRDRDALGRAMLGTHVINAR
jgi:simple sugar transport system ATP-binding protein